MCRGDAQGKGKEVGAYEFSFHLTYAVRCHINGVPTSMVVGPRTAVILLRVEVETHAGHIFEHDANGDGGKQLKRI